MAARAETPLKRADPFQRSGTQRRSTAGGMHMAGDKTDASKLMDEKIRELGDWRGETLSTVRGIIRS
jgi:hypothetical protein